MIFMISQDPPKPASAPARKGTFGLGSSKKNRNAGIAHATARVKRSHVSRMVIPSSNRFPRETQLKMETF